LVQVRVVEHLPKPIYGLPISLRMIGSHSLDRSQCKREKCVAAVQGRPYRLRTDKLAESHHCRGVGKSTPTTGMEQARKLVRRWRHYLRVSGGRVSPGLRLMHEAFWCGLFHWPNRM
jgi:hypothetical protein